MRSICIVGAVEYTRKEDETVYIIHDDLTMTRNNFYRLIDSIYYSDEIYVASDSKNKNLVKEVAKTFNKGDKVYER